MKSFKNIFAVIILCSISCTHTKQTGARAVQPTQPVSTQPQIQPQPRLQVQPKPQSQIQPAQKQTFQQLVNYVKTAKSNDVWDNADKMLKKNFLVDMIQKATNANLNKDQLDILLIIARDFHAQFTGDNIQDSTILTKLAQQREAAQDLLNDPLFSTHL